MHLKILLPFEVFTEQIQVERIVAETSAGSYGFLPQRRDCVAALIPGILTYQQQGGDEVYVAVDEGILVKTGKTVLVSVRRAIAGKTLAQLREAVEQEFLSLDEQNLAIRATLAKLEVGFLHRFMDLEHD